MTDFKETQNCGGGSHLKYSEVIAWRREDQGVGGRQRKGIWPVYGESPREKDLRTDTWRMNSRHPGEEAGRGYFHTK